MSNMAIKVIHFADVHIGIENYGQLNPATGLSTRLSDFLSALDRVVETAVDEDFDLVVFAGDAYRTREPSPTYQREFARRVRLLSRAGVPTVLVAGNHDLPNAVKRAHTLEIFDALEVENVYTARLPGVLDIETRHGPVQVGVMPWVVRSTLLSRDQYKSKSIEEINRLMLDRVDVVLNGEQGLTSRLRPDVPHILVAHCTVQSAEYGSERKVTLGHDVVWPLEVVKRPDWDYVALGHIHRHQALEADRDPPVVYSGSIERIDFGEEREEKGFVVAHVGRGGCDWSFRPLPARPFVTIRVRAEGDDPNVQVLEAIRRARVEDAVVRVIVQTTAESEVLIHDREVRRALRDKGAFFISAIIHDVTRPVRLRLGDHADVAELTPLEALECYFKVKEVSAERIATLMHHARSLFS